MVRRENIMFAYKNPLAPIRWGSMVDISKQLENMDLEAYDDTDRHLTTHTASQ